MAHRLGWCCCECLFWCPEYDPPGLPTGRGQCRRYAPRALALAEDEEHGAYWTVTTDVEWCGEFKRDTAVDSVYGPA